MKLTRLGMLAAAAVCLAGCGGGTPASTASTSAPPPAADSSTEASPAGLSCADIGGVFVAHGTDGRGDCEPADPSPKCHVPPAQQDGNYLAVMTLDPPTPDGVVADPSLLTLPISNPQCWKIPKQ
jgi:hypothetical protein